MSMINGNYQNILGGNVPAGTSHVGLFLKKNEQIH